MKILLATPMLDGATDSFISTNSIIFGLFVVAILINLYMNRG